MFHKKAKTTKKVVLRLECTSCKTKAQLSLKRCKHFELGYVRLIAKSSVSKPLTFFPVVTRRPRVLPLCSRRVLSSTAHGLTMVDYYSCMFALVYSVKAESHYGFFHPCPASTLDTQVSWHFLRDVCVGRERHVIIRDSPRRTVSFGIPAILISLLLDIGDERFHPFSRLTSFTAVRFCSHFKWSIGISSTYALAVTNHAKITQLSEVLKTPLVLRMAIVNTNAHPSSWMRAARKASPGFTNCSMVLASDQRPFIGS